MLSRFHLVPERYGRTDRRMDRQICYIISRVSMLARDKNSRVRRIHICQSRQCNSTNSAAILRMEIKHVAAYYFLRTINCRVDLRCL